MDSVKSSTKIIGEWVFFRIFKKILSEAWVPTRCTPLAALGGSGLDLSHQVGEDGLPLEAAPWSADLAPCQGADGALLPLQSEAVTGKIEKHGEWRQCV